MIDSLFVNLFTGTYHSKVDNIGRILIPQGLRNLVRPEPVVYAFVDDRLMRAYSHQTLTEANDITHKTGIEELLGQSPSAEERLKFFSSARRYTLDEKGRLYILKTDMTLQELFPIGTPLLLLGNGTHFVIQRRDEQ